MTDALIKASNLFKNFMIGSTTLEVLKGINLFIRGGEFVAIMGASGSGKSTLLHILGCLDRPTSGAYLFAGQDTATLSDRQRSRVRARSVGFIFQNFHLLPQLDVFENVELPFQYSDEDDLIVKEKVMEAIAQVGMTDRIGHRPAELSGGEMQRVAIARAIVTSPTLLLADEPTGNLDSRTGRDILLIFKKLHMNGATIILVTHDREVAAYAQKVVMLKDGRFTSEKDAACSD
ncbi:MAG: ABC transporter ATP-binding protein [Thermodesulfobacteriota bacterium]